MTCKYCQDYRDYNGYLSPYKRTNTKLRRMCLELCECTDNVGRVPKKTLDQGEKLNVV